MVGYAMIDRVVLPASGVRVSGSGAMVDGRGDGMGVGCHELRSNVDSGCCGGGVHLLRAVASRLVSVGHAVREWRSALRSLPP